ncbi:chitin synthase-domain-containing protein [Hyaloraphidium curvatum]|nr:chitin synthase-domain-containing protein [Hyaloraphidium curvatum]
MTMYNEDPYLFARSMHALVENMKTLLAKWGPDAWKRVVVVIVSDGRSKIHPGTLEALGVMGVYQDGVMKSEVGGREVASHIFEYTSQIDLAEAGEGKGIRAVESVPVQVVFCLKEQNAKKINSHRWFFNAFCPLLNPRICLLLDVGTRPSAAALYQMWDCFDKHPNVGGACGEIVADISPGWSGVLNPLVASQAFEYKISNQLDKPLESSFGYISVLPGAFSAYRYSALTNISPGVGPLAAYFHGESVHSGAASGGILESNMYLAEDRVLCFELVAKPGEAWVLRYIASAAAVTDVPETIPELVSQRRRWLNGSTFASIYAIANWSRIYKSDHSFGRKVVFTFQFLYHIASLIFSWFTLANFFLVAYFLLVANVPDPLRNYPLAFGQAGDVVAYVVIVVYAYLLVVQFLLSMGSKPASTITLYRIILMLWMGIMGIILYLIGFTAYNIITQAEKQIAAGGLWPVLVENSSFTALIAAMFACWGIWIVAGLLFLDPWHCIHSLMQFMLLSPFWNNVLQVYAMSNTHDVSWGTKGSTKAHSLGAANPIVAEEDKGPKTVELELPAEDRLDEANRAYQSQMQHLAQPDPAPSKTKGWFARPETTDQEESFRRYRVVLLVSWASSNLALVLVMTNPTVVNAMTAAAGGLINPYLQMLFWVSLGFSVVKFLGLLWYLLFQRLIDRRESIESEYVGESATLNPPVMVPS